MFPNLQYFKRSEFKHPDSMNVDFLVWLDSVRDLSGVPIVITDDFRNSKDLPSGASTTSLHFKGRAVDIRSRNLNRSQKYRLAKAIFDLEEFAPGKIEFELVHGPRDSHWHLGVDDSKDAENELIEADD